MIDWAIYDAAKYPEDTCRCVCGAVWRTHSRLVTEDGHLILRTRKPCPNCSKNNNVKSVHSDLERFSIG